MCLCGCLSSRGESRLRFVLSRVPRLLYMPPPSIEVVSAWSSKLGSSFPLMPSVNNGYISFTSIKNIARDFFINLVEHEGIKESIHLEY